MMMLIIKIIILKDSTINKDKFTINEIIILYVLIFNLILVLFLFFLELFSYL
jgi:hypothetical protein